MSAEETTEPDEVLTDDELQAAAAPEQSIEEDDKPRERTVVVAEDESVNRMDLVAMLEDSGYEVVGEAANGEEAVELTRKSVQAWYAWTSRCLVWMASKRRASSVMRISLRSLCLRHSPSPICQEGHGCRCHGIRHQAV